MRRPFGSLLIGLLAVSAGLSCSKTTRETGKSSTDSAAQEAGRNSADSEMLQVAVVTGGHAFDIPNFYRLFRELPGIDAYPQHLEHFASSPQEVRDSYDVIVFYGMDQGLPYEKDRRAGGNAKAAIERLVARGQGLVLLHHALLAWEEWDLWNQLIGVDNRNFRFKEGLQMSIKVSDPSHAITQGLDDFAIDDEGYVLHGQHDSSSSVLLTTEHADAMEQVAWARESGKSRVFCLALGHDNLAWKNDSFRTLLENGIVWSSGASSTGDDR